MRNKEKRFG